jgi:glycosyltransferase involved in cell wall biosynthesis
LLDTTVAQTDTTAKWLLDNTRTCHVTVIPNAINCPAPANGDSPESETLAGQRKILAAAGRLHPLKGFNHLVSAFASICQTRPDWCLMIAGEGDQREALEAQISQLGLHDRIFMLGRVKNINAFFSRADIFALTSSHEGFPNVLLEAMACGLPAVSFDCEAGPRAIIRDGEDGILVPPGDRDALASAIASLMDDENRRRKMGSAATLVCDRFSPARVLQLWDRVLHNKTLS